MPQPGPQRLAGPGWAGCRVYLEVFLERNFSSSKACWNKSPVVAPSSLHWQEADSGQPVMQAWHPESSQALWAGPDTQPSTPPHPVPHAKSRESTAHPSPGVVVGLGNLER